MLRISKLADYGTVAMAYLAKQGHVASTARDVALNTHLTLPTASKILKRLTRADLLISLRGALGGYRLKRAACDISVAHIIYALEGAPGITECSLKLNDCSLQKVCAVQTHWQMIGRVITAALDSVTLEALAKPALQKEEMRKISKIVSGVYSD